MNDTVLKENSFDFFLDKRGFYFLYIREGEDYTLDDFKKVVNYIQNSCNGVRAPFLVKFGYGCTFGDGVMELLTTSPSRFSTADALVINTYAHKLTAKFYLKHYDPSTPTDVFDTQDKALDWLQPYLNP